MGPLINWLKVFFTSRYGEKGATAIEYGLLVALIAVVIIVAVTAVGGNLKGMFNAVADEISTTIPAE
ncbi:MAG: Flp family type IVb pilin [Actinomycetia bacterium]|nr:Flp family type IVb pilin [Actinomycetes bacterium]